MTRALLGEMSLFPFRYGKVNFTAMLSPLVIFRLIKFYIYEVKSVLAGLSKKAVLPYGDCLLLHSLYNSRMHITLLFYTSIKFYFSFRLKFHQIQYGIYVNLRKMPNCNW